MTTFLRRILTYPWRRFQMARVGRGFSVHSPFAYHFIHFVLRETAPYYCFRDQVVSRAERRLFRVVNHFGPATVAFVGDSAAARRVVGLACPRAAEISDPALADFVFVAADSPLPAAFRVLYAAHSPQLPPAAMTFTNGRTLIAVRRPSLPPQSFRLHF